MASVTLGTLRDYWKNVSQWVTGTSSSLPVVKTEKNRLTLDKTEGFSITAGSAVAVLGNESDEVSKIFGVLKTDSHHDFSFRLRTRYVVSDSNSFTGEDTYLNNIVSLDLANKNGAVTSAYDAVGEKFEAVVVNNDTLDHTYNVLIGGLK